MKKLSKLMTLLGVACMASPLGACSRTPKEDGGDGPVDPPAVTSVEIDFWHTFGQTIINGVQSRINTFKELVKKVDGVDLTVNLVPNSNYDTIKDSISKGLISGNIPTIAVAYSDHVADYIDAENGEDGKYVVNLDNYINSDKYGFGKEPGLGDKTNDSIDDFLAAYIDAGRHFKREGTYTFPFMKSTEAMLYNYDAVVKVLKFYKPEFQGSETAIKNYMNTLTWDEFMNLCEQVWIHKDIINPDLKYSAIYDSDANLFVSHLFQNSIDYSSIIDNGSGKKVGHIDFAQGENRTKAENMVKQFRNAYRNNYLATKGILSTYGSDSFKNVESVFVIGSTGGSGYSISEEFTTAVCKAPFDKKEKYISQGVELVIMNNPTLSKQANESRQLYAWKLLKYLTNPTVNTYLCLRCSEGYSPVRYSCYEEDLYLDLLDSGEIKGEIYDVVFNDIGNNLINTVYFPGSADLRKECGGIITESLVADDESKITSIFDTAISNATTKMK